MKKVVALIFVVACASDAFAQLPLKVLTLNTRHGGQAPFSVDDQVAAIAAESPDVVLLQEADRAQLDLYVRRLNDALGTTAWHGAAAQHCMTGDSERCTSYTDESVMVALYTVPSGVAASGNVPAIPTAAPTPALAPPNGETVLIEDDFDGDLPDVAKWPAGIVSGTEDRTVPVAQTGGAIAIGPLFANASGFHYNGPSSPAFDLSSGGYAQVRLVQAVVGDQANAMFTAANGSTNFYRIYQTGAAGAQRIAVEKKIADVKYQLASAAYDPAVHQLLRIRPDRRPSIGVDDVVFETAAVTAAGTPFVEMYREPWDASIQADRLVFEIKAGTSDKESAPGVAVWDNFRVALQPVSEP